MTDLMNHENAPIASQLVSDDSSFAELVGQFVEGLRERIEKMEQAVHASDFEALRVCAHQLKGSGGGYGYPILTTQAASLEDCAKDRMLEDCQKELANLREICKRLVVSDAL